MTSTSPPRFLARPPKPSFGRRSLLCMPFAGGGVGSYTSWHRMLPATVEAMTVMLPGRDARIDQPLPTSLVDVAAEIADELEPYLTGPFVLFGHSMGAILAYELTLALRSSYGVEPRCLIVSGMCAPMKVAEATRYTHLPEEEFRAALKAMGGTTGDVLDDPGLWKIYAPIIRSDLAMFESYVYRPAEPIVCPIVAYGSHGDPDTDLVGLHGWRALTSAASATRMFSGDHFYFRSRPEAFVADLVNRLHQYLLS
jgi:medium-chain acyl-[acyl-carrier-protein] hydrolase